MGQPIATIPLDPVVNPTDYIVGTDSLTGKSYSYQIQTLGEWFTANASSVITTTNIYDVTETSVKDWIDVINTAPIAWVVASGQWATVNRYDESSTFIGTYVLKKENTENALYGNGELQVTEDDFLPVRIVDDSGQANTASSSGGFSLVQPKNGVDLPFKGLEAGTNISIVGNANTLEIAMSGTLGEINTLGDVGSGEPLAGVKSGQENKVKSISVVGGTVSSDTTDLTITNWSKERKTASWTLADSDKFKTFHIDNAAAAVVVTIPDDLSADFEAGFVQLGTGNVTFAEDGSTILGAYNAINGQLQSAYVETQVNTTTNIILQGQIKTI